ncbi:hypothetical protein BD311DRAFT_663677 [Dichomitus squalens]|uniref:DUF6533 domain-containing protein n=1 Tax=Dichomitus squalens TaxID=114155 RepID=A0A4Q9MMX4_9APHY|nr:hypothetical protein BD311DRAFT_663677 [Dichomitus squalens]
MADNSEVQALYDVFFGDCWAYACIALLSYDYVLTFSSEVTLFWMGGRLSGPIILFLLTRYITLTAQIIGLFPFPSSVEACLSTAFSMFVALNVFRAFQYLPWAAFSALRSHALCPGPYRWPVSATVFALSAVPIVTDMWGNLYRLSFVNDPELGILPTNPIAESTVLKRDITVEVATRSSLIASDLVVLFVTWYRTYQTAKLSLRSLRKESFARILLLDGVPHRIQLPDCQQDTVSSLTAILTSRFLIDLQNAQCKLAGSSRSVSFGELAFEPQTSRNTSRIIGSLGVQLSFRDGFQDGEDEVEDAM